MGVELSRVKALLAKDLSCWEGIINSASWAPNICQKRLKTCDKKFACNTQFELGQEESQLTDVKWTEPNVTNYNTLDLDSPILCMTSFCHSFWSAPSGGHLSFSRMKGSTGLFHFWAICRTWPMCLVLLISGPMQHTTAVHLDIFSSIVPARPELFSRSSCRSSVTKPLASSLKKS